MNSLSMPEFLTVFLGVCSDATATNSSMLYVITSVWNTLRSLRAWKKSLFAKLKKNRKSKTNTRKSVRSLFESVSYSPCTPVIFLVKSKWDEESLCSDKGKKNSAYTIGVTYLTENEHEEAERTEHDGKRTILATSVGKHRLSVIFQRAMLFFEYMQKVISRHLLAIGCWRREAAGGHFNKKDTMII